MHVLLVGREYYVDLLHALMTIMYLFIQLNKACSLPVLYSHYEISKWMNVLVGVNKICLGKFP